MKYIELFENHNHFFYRCDLLKWEECFDNTRELTDDDKDFIEIIIPDGLEVYYRRKFKQSVEQINVDIKRESTYYITLHIYACVAGGAYNNDWLVSCTHNIHREYIGRDDGVESLLDFYYVNGNEGLRKFIKYCIDK